MTPAEELRAAARMIRERAEAATPGRWYATEEDVLTDGGDALHWAGACVANSSGADGRHIASWSPPVALAVADLLELEAKIAESITRLRDLIPPEPGEGPGLAPLNEAIDAVARAYLAGEGR
jgi:hypothetical protein